MICLVSCAPLQAQYFTRILDSGPVPCLKGTVLRQAVGNLKAGDSIDFATADWNGDGRLDVIAGSCYGDLMYFAQHEGGIFGQPAAMLPVPDEFEAYRYRKNPATPELFDWQGDGQLDLLLGTGGEVYLYLRQGSGLSSGATLLINTGEGLGAALRRIASSPAPGQLAPCVADLDGDGVPDLLLGDDAGRVWWVHNEGIPSRPALSAPQPLAAGGKAIQVAGRARVAVGDVNGDGILDLVVGDAEGNLYLYAGSKTGLDAPVPLLGKNPVSELTDNVAAQDISPRLVDWNHDGKVDLLLGDRRGFIAVFRNDGQGSMSLQGYLQQENAPVTVGRCAAPTVVDWNGDGKPDIVCGGEDGYVTVFENTGTPTAPVFSPGKRVTVDGKPLIARPGPGEQGSRIRCSWPRVADMNGDGRLDLLLGGAFGGLELYLNSAVLHSEGELKTGNLPIHTEGISAPTPLDWGGSGRMDIILGSRPIPGVASQSAVPLGLPRTCISYYENAASRPSDTPVYLKGVSLDFFLQKPNRTEPVRDAGFLLLQTLDPIAWTTSAAEKRYLVMTASGAMIFESTADRKAYPYFFLDTPPGAFPTTILPPLYSCTPAVLSSEQRPGLLVGTEAYGLVCYYPREAF